MHFGIITSPVPGHLNPLCTVGRALKDLGHKVTVFGLLDTEKKILQEGLEFLSYGEKEFPRECWESHWIKMAKKTGIPVLFMTSRLHSLLSKVMCRDIPSKIFQHKIDALVIDQLQFQGKAIAHYCNIPYVNFSCTLVLNKDLNNLVPPPFVPWGYNHSNSIKFKLLNTIAWKVADLLSKPIISYGNKLVGIKVTRSMEDSYSQLLQIVPMPKTFDFPSRLNHNSVSYVGSVIDERRPIIDFPYEKIKNGVPLIYASCGTLQNHRMDIYEHIANACKDLNVQLVIALGDWRKERKIPQFAGTPIVVGYAPQIELLKKSALCITHAGPNTVYEAFSIGVPLVAIPIANDQVAVGARLKISGAAEVIDLNKLSVDILKEKILKVLDNPIYKLKANEFKNEIQNLGGVKFAASLIEKKIHEHTKLS